MRVKVVITGRAYDQPGEAPSALDSSPDADVDAALEALRSTLLDVSPSALVAVSGAHVGTVAAHTARTLVDGE